MSRIVSIVEYIIPIFILKTKKKLCFNQFFFPREVVNQWLLRSHIVIGSAMLINKLIGRVHGNETLNF